MIGTWKESGYNDFADGNFENGGQNIYVSRAGFLQRIFRFDFNGDGYTDLLFVNSQDMNECPPIYVCKDISGSLKIAELPTQGAYAGAVGDLNNDGYDDLVIANQHNGIHSDITAYVYFGSSEGLSERYKMELPAPNARAVAIGDFNGDGRPDIAFSCEGKLRIFYQTETGFIAGKYMDFNMEITHMTAGDLDGDGCSELYVRVRKDRPCVFWGGRDGINPQRYTIVGGDDLAAEEIQSSTPGRMDFAEGWVPKILSINSRKYLFRSEEEQACLFPVLEDRNLGTPLRFNCSHAVSAAAGDINADGMDDIILAICRHRNENDISYIYWGTEKGFDDEHRTALPTISARDVAIGDLNGNGYADVVLCQGRTDILNTTESLIFSGCKNGINTNPLRVTTHDATAVLIAKTCDHENPQVIFINHEGGRVCGDIPAYIYYGGQDGFSVERRDELPGWSAPESICCDFNDDGWADILICNCAENAPHLDPGSFLYWGGPNGFNTERKLIIPTFRAWGAAVGDFRHTGYLDVVFGGFSNPELLIFHGGHDGLDLEHPQRILMDTNLTNYVQTKEFKEYQEKEGLEFREPRWLLSADFNNDGWLDLFVSQIGGQRCFILWGGADGFSMDRCTWLNVEGSACAQAADLNGDGWLDLIVGSYQSMSKNWKFDSYINIYWGGPDGFREDRRTQLPVHAGDSITIADFNNDGILDIFAGSYHGGRVRDLDSYIYWGAPGGIYTASNHTRLFTHSVSGCVAADFNEDGWIDIAVANHKTYGNHTGYSQVWWNGPEGFSERNVLLLPTLGPHGMTTVDPGNIMDRSQEEYYISSGYQLPEGAKVIKICWEAEIPPKTWVKAQIRFAYTKKHLDDAVWQGPDDTQLWFNNGQTVNRLNQNGCWIQYRLALGAVNGGNSPRVTEVSVFYLE